MPRVLKIYALFQLEIQWRSGCIRFNIVNKQTAMWFLKVSELSPGSTLQWHQHIYFRRKRVTSDYTRFIDDLTGFFIYYVIGITSLPNNQMFLDVVFDYPILYFQGFCRASVPPFFYRTSVPPVFPP